MDHFKTINDMHGHAVGDRLLKRAVTACQIHLRSTDVFGRLGGEEFGIVFPASSVEQTLARIDLIRLAIATVDTSGEAVGIAVSASFAIACSQSSSYELRQSLIDGDVALYRAKDEGRNRVSVSDEVLRRRQRGGAVKREPA